MMRVLLLRHGQSEWNASGRWQGQADPALTELGRLQARHASRAIGAVEAIFASDLERAAHTAAIIADEVGVGPVQLDPGLRERHAGEWQGLTRAEIERDWPGYLNHPPPPIEGSREHRQEDASVGDQAARASEAEGRPERRPPGWEPDDTLVERAIAALVRIHATVGGGDVLAVTHGGLIYALERVLGAPFIRLPNLGGRWVEVDERGPVALGDRVVLIDHDELTIPNQI